MDFHTQTRRIGISLGDLDNLQHGLGEFATQLLSRIAGQAAAWRDRHGVVFDLHVAPRHAGMFGPSFRYLAAEKTQRRRAPSTERYAIWHTLHQLSRLQPPVEAGLRLLTVHDLIFLDEGSFVSRSRRRWRMGRLASRTDAVVAISRWTAREVQRRLAWSRPIEVIHNGVRDLSDQPRQPLPCAAALAGRPFLFHLSRLAPSKNPQAILGLARHWPSMNFVLCGPSSGHSLSIARQHGLANVHVCLDITDEQKAWAYAQCHGFVFPSLAEGFGLPPVEAMHFGKPAFLSNRTSLPEIGGDAAWYFESFEPQAMRAVVERGLLEAADPARQARIRARALSFNWDRCCESYLALYRRQLGLAASPPSHQASPEAVASMASSQARSTADGA